MRISDWSSDVCSSDLSVHHHRPYGLAALHQFEAFVDLVQTQCMGDEVVDVDLAVHIPVDDLGNIGTAACAAECRAFPFASGNQLEGAGGDFGAGLGHRSEEHTSELPSLMRISYAVFCLIKKK